MNTYTYGGRTLEIPTEYELRRAVAEWEEAKAGKLSEHDDAIRDVNEHLEKRSVS